MIYSVKINASESNAAIWRKNSFKLVRKNPIGGAEISQAASYASLKR